ncbi:MAG: Y-family DNA polymerase [Muribaculum sp.]|nr:Y-family DNA polymerase [Muribaculum sp.]
MIGHIDCNSFFVSCERVFRPDLEGKPVVVLTNNDGCISSLSPEAKKLGLKRGTPFFKFKQIAEANGVVCFSCNHRLYGDMSSRVMSTLRSLSDDVEIYSIDDAFIRLDECHNDDLGEFGHYIVHKIRRDVGIPTSMGIAPTKTLGKLASHFAKRYPAYRGVAVIDSVEKSRKAMSLVQVEDIWGIGRRLAERLHQIGIDTALALADMTEERAKELFNVTAQRTWRELNGQPCIPYEAHHPDQKTMTSSRSFATDISDFGKLTEAISEFAGTIARKLRRDNMYALEISVFLTTNRFHPDEPQIFDSAQASFPEGTNDTIMITKAAVEAMSKIFRRGYKFKKAGLTATRIVNQDGLQHELFTDPEVRDRRRRLMSTIDAVNAACLKKDIVRLASTGNGISTLVRHDLGSPLYTTRLSDIITVHV